MTLKILVPLDGSGFGEAALTAAARLTAETQVELDLLRVVPPVRGTQRLAYSFAPQGSGVPGDFYPPQVRAVETATQAAERQESEALDYLTDIAQRMPSASATFSVRCGSEAAEEIVAAAKDFGADLIVMATHGQGGLLHVLLGSVAESVLRKSTIPVLLVRASSAQKA